MDVHSVKCIQNTKCKCNMDMVCDLAGDDDVSTPAMVLRFKNFVLEHQETKQVNYILYQNEFLSNAFAMY